MKKLLLLIVAAFTIGNTTPAFAASDVPGPLTYYGGPVERTTHFYYVYWGNWNFVDASGNTGAAAESFVQGFGQGLGLSSYNNLLTQYCQSGAIGSTSCPVNGPQNIENNYATQVTTWADSSAIPCTQGTNPCTPSSTDIQNEAIKGAEHFGCTLTRCTYQGLASVLVVLTPYGIGATGNYAGFHDWVPPFYVNTDAFLRGVAWAWAHYPTGNIGEWNAWTGTLSHEFAETQTDPEPSASTGWADPLKNSEIADMCASYSANVVLNNGSTYFVSQLYSNAAGGCASSY